MSNSRKGLKRRSSIITIIFVLVILAFIAFLVIKVLDKKEKDVDENKQYISNLDEEDMMQYEYSKIDKSLNGMYALGVQNDYIVGVKSTENIVNIVQIDPEKDYDYKYYNTKLYLLEKECGKISVIDLNELGKIDEIIELNSNIKSFEVNKNGIFYISEDKLLKYEKGNIEEILGKVTSNNFIIKNDLIYIVKDYNLIKLDMNNNEEIIASNVNEIYYYNYYERDRLIYDTTLDGTNIFKNIYNFYTGQITNSIKNNTYFVPYESSKYVYTSSDNMNVILIGKNGTNEYLYKSENKIEDVVFYKEGYIILKINDKEIVINLNTGNQIESDNIINLNNIKYLK